MSIIKFADVKEGDRIRITRDLVVNSVRLANVGAVPAAIIEFEGPRGPQTLAVTADEKVDLLDRPVKAEEGATFVYWRSGGSDCYARKLEDGRWLDYEGDKFDSLSDLIEEIENGEFSYGKYETGSFQVIAREPKQAEDGEKSYFQPPQVALSPVTQALLNNSARNRVLGVANTLNHFRRSDVVQ